MSVGSTNRGTMNPASQRAVESFEKRMNADDKVNILIVDDQPGKLLSYDAILSELGENLVQATSGKEALEKLLT